MPIDNYVATVTRTGNATLAASRVLDNISRLRAPAFRQGATETGVEKLATLATFTTSTTTHAGLSFNGLDDTAATALGCCSERGVRRRMLWDRVGADLTDAEAHLV